MVIIVKDAEKITKTLHVEFSKGCGKKFKHEFLGERICGHFEDLKHSDHFIYCDACLNSNKNIDDEDREIKERIEKTNKELGRFL